MDKIRNRPDVLVALLIAMVALFLVSILMLMIMPSLPYVRNY